MGARGPVARRPSLPTARLERFEPPEGLCDEALAQWDAFWADESLSPSPSDRILVVRWVESLNRHLVASREADAEPLVRGSQGQMVTNPRYRIAEKALAVAEKCERQLGVASRPADPEPAAGRPRSLAELNSRYEEADGGDGDDGAAEEDPRLVVIDSGSDASRAASRRGRRVS